MPEDIDSKILPRDVISKVGKDLALGVTFEITHRCNFRCPHCYGTSQRCDKDMTLEQILRIIDQMADHGVLTLSLTGGDPLTRKDFPEIYRHARECGMLVTVLTNATQLTEEHIKLFQEYPVSQLSITMYGYTKDTYEAMSRVPGSYNRFMNAIDMIVDAGLPCELKGIATKITRDDLLKMRDFAKSKGLHYRYSTKIIPENDGDKTPYCIALSPSETFWFDTHDEDKLKAWEYATKVGEEGQPNLQKRIKEGKFYLCHAGQGTVAISASGTLYLCLGARKKGYDLLKGDFSDGYETFVKHERERLAPCGYGCLKCPYIRYCDQCGGEIDRVGDFKYGQEDTCKVAMMRQSYFTGKHQAALPD
ncbi:MAG: radical SAM protein [Atopobiaceae bacterium]